MPGMPLMPGVVMCEAAAQLCSYHSQRHNLLGCEMVGFGGMDGVRFRGTMVPGDRLVIVAQKLQLRVGAMIRCRFQCFVNEQLVCEGQIRGIPIPVAALSARALRAGDSPCSFRCLICSRIGGCRSSRCCIIADQLRRHGLDVVAARGAAEPDRDGVWLRPGAADARGQRPADCGSRFKAVDLVWPRGADCPSRSLSTDPAEVYPTFLTTMFSARRLDAPADEHVDVVGVRQQRRRSAWALCVFGVLPGGRCVATLAFWASAPKH